MRVNKNSFVKSLPITAKGLSEKFGVTVKFEDGACPCTDGSGITLPTLEEDAQVKDKCALLGALVHECSHVRNTDFGLSSRKNLPQGMFSALNAVEDLRIENLACKQYPGAAYMITASDKEALKDYDWDKVAQSKPLILFFYSMVYSKQHLMQDFKGKYLLEFEKAEKAAKSALGDKILLKVNDILTSELDSLGSTEDALTLAEKLMSLLDKKSRASKGQKGQQGQQGQQSQVQQNGQQGGGQSANQQSDGQNQQQQGSKGQDGLSQDQNQGKQDQQGSSQNQSNGSSDSSNQNQDSSENQNSSNGGITGSYEIPEGITRESKKNRTQGFDNPWDKSQKLHREMQAVADETRTIKDPKCTPAQEPTEQDVLSRVGGTRGLTESLKEEGKRIEVNAGRLTAGLSRGIRGLVQTMSAQPAITGYSGKKLDYAHISRIADWDLRVFKKVGVAKSERTVVHILMDRSGSMDGSRLEKALCASVALYQAVDRIPEAKAHLSVFPATYESPRRTIIPTGGNLKRLLPAVADISACGCTPFLEAVEQERQLLNKETADKKVLLVLTDGDTGDDPVMTKQLKSRLVRDGIVFGGVAVGDDGGFRGLKNFFEENFCYVKELEKLPGEFMGLARKLILRK